MSDWKQAHADEADRFSRHELIEDVLTEFAGNMKFAREGLPEYGLQKIVNCVAQVVLARAKGLDPDLLRLSSEEVDNAQWRLMKLFMTTGNPVIVINDEQAK